MVGADFPVLGLPRWPGTRGPRISGAADGVRTSCVHSYGLDGRRAPAVLVIAQTAGSGPGAGHLPVAVRNLLLGPGRPREAEEVSRAQESAVVLGALRPCVRVRWSDPHIDDVRFAWTGFHVHAASWDHPLDAAFFASLGVL